MLTFRYSDYAYYPLQVEVGGATPGLSVTTTQVTKQVGHPHHPTNPPLVS
jgi:hypothetical protein